jgi:DNA polymerase-3 subunit epsilon
MNIEHLNPDHEELAQRLQRDDDYRVLRAVPKPYCAMPENGAPPSGKCIAIVDTETTGLDADNDTIIELAIMHVFVDHHGELLGHFGPFSWLQDPGEALDPRITMVTGLAAQQLAGQKIDDAFAVSLLDRADLIVAHNAAFDAGFIERRYPQIAVRAWACSCSEIDWLKLGYDGRAQQHLLAQAGWFSSAHRAASDVWSLFWLLQQRQHDPRGGIERTHLARLLEASETPTVMLQAEGAPYSTKDTLKARGYRWNAGRGFWQRELPADKVEHEQAWAYRNGLRMLTERAMTACNRHR